MSDVLRHRTINKATVGRSHSGNIKPAPAISSWQSKHMFPVAVRGLPTIGTVPSTRPKGIPRRPIRDRKRHPPTSRTRTPLRHGSHIYPPGSANFVEAAYTTTIAVEMMADNPYSAPVQFKPSVSSIQDTTIGRTISPKAPHTTIMETCLSDTA